MTKEEYLKREDALHNKIDEIRDEIKNLRKEYIKENKSFPIGTKVRITNDNYPHLEKEGIVSDYGVTCSGNVQPIVMKIKKDGTAHPRSRVWISWSDKLEPIGT